MKKIVLLLALAFATPAAAAPLVACVFGCDKLVSSSLKAGLPGEYPVTTALWLGPSVGFDAFTHWSGNNTWTAGFVPGVGYGLKWRPEGWAFSTNALALDLFVQAGWASLADTAIFNVDVLPALTIIDWISIGLGYRYVMTTSDGHGKGGLVFSIGIRKAIGSP
jgi:hypothetical protein